MRTGGRTFGTALYVLAAISAVGFAMNLVFGPQWIEAVFGIDPDGGDGSLEALVVLAPAVAAAVFAVAGFVFRRRRPRPEAA
ncbi:ABC transporter permease [Rhodococcus aetherivorans]|nr:ABC transporter permease [Rhodococcus aetherivorans]